MNNAERFSCTVIKNPDNLKYDESIRQFQGCPTVAVTKGGRIFLGWYAGGIKEPHMNNYNLLIYSDDKGKTWSDPVLIIPSSYTMSVHALDIQLFIDPKGALHVCWVQNNTIKSKEPIMKKSGKPAVKVDGYAFVDFKHSEWEVVCNNPDAEELDFSAPRYLHTTSYAINTATVSARMTEKPLLITTVPKKSEQYLTKQWLMKETTEVFVCLPVLCTVMRQNAILTITDALGLKRCQAELLTPIHAFLFKDYRRAG